MKQNTPQVVTPEEPFFEEAPEMTPPQTPVPSVFQPPQQLWLFLPPLECKETERTTPTHSQKAWRRATFPHHSPALSCAVVWALPLLLSPRSQSLLCDCSSEELGLCLASSSKPVTVALQHIFVFLREKLVYNLTSVSGDACTHKVIAMIKSSWTSWWLRR